MGASAGHAGHTWTTIGAIAQVADHLEVGTGVVAMLHRSHPVNVAHAAATAAVLLDGRFFLGVGTGERLIHVSLAATRDAALDNAWTWWPNGAVAAPVLTELARPEHFDAVSRTATDDTLTSTVACAVDAEPIIGAIDRYVGAGFDTVYLHQIGPDQARLADLARTELLPRYESTSASSSADSAVTNADLHTSFGSPAKQ